VRAALPANERKLEITETAVMEGEQHVISVNPMWQMPL
jgi:hypothetical protein